MLSTTFHKVLEKSKINRIYSEDIGLLLKSMLDPIAEDRIGFMDIIRHPEFALHFKNVGAASILQSMKKTEAPVLKPMIEMGQIGTIHQQLIETYGSKINRAQPIALDLLELKNASQKGPQMSSKRANNNEEDAKDFKQNWNNL